jgi:Tfp pilus assembly protein PilF
MANSEALEKLLASGKDSAMLRLSLGNIYLEQQETQKALEHLLRAIELDSQYSAAWKALGKTYVAIGDNSKAVATYTRGIAIAEDKGDKQAAKEMQVFLKRLQK